MPKLADALTQIVQQTEAMLIAAQQEDWDQLCAIEQARRQAISAFFQGLELITVAQQQMIQQVIELDKKTVVLAENGRAGLGDSIRSFEKGRHMNKQYQDTLKLGRH